MKGSGKGSGSDKAVTRAVGVTRAAPLLTWSLSIGNASERKMTAKTAAGGAAVEGGGHARKERQ